MLKLDAWALGFTFALTFLTTHLRPASGASIIEGQSQRNLEGRRSRRNSGTRAGVLRSLLVVSEIALAMVLLVGAGLMLKTFWRLNQVNLGFSPAGALTAQIDPTYKEFDEVVEFLPEPG